MRVGVVGCGWVANDRHIPSLQRIPGVEIVAVADRHLDRAQATAVKANAFVATDSTQRVLDENLDIVVIATSPWAHAELAIAALDAGAHVFCEKPMALDAKDAAAMVEAAERNQRLLCISHNFLYSRSVRAADRLLAGVEPSFVSGLQLSSFARRLPTWYEELPGGLMLDESPHLLYVLTHFLGAPLSLVHARAVPDRYRPWPSMIELQLEGARGPGTISMCFDTPVSEWHVGVITPKRIVGLDLFRDIVTSVGPDREHKALDILKTSGRVIAAQLAGTAKTGVRIAAKRQFWGHDELIAKFVDACRTGGPSPVDPRDSLSIVQLTDSILGSLDLRGSG